MKVLYSVEDMSPCLRGLRDSQVDVIKKHPPLGTLGELWAGDMHHQHTVTEARGHARSRAKKMAKEGG